MNTTIKSLLALFLISIAGWTYADTVVRDVYSLKMVLDVPRTFNNTQSLGYRKKEKQTILADLYVDYDENEEATFTIVNMYNKTHKINGKSITYSVTCDNYGDYVYPRWCYIGNNKTDEFTTPCIELYIDCDPSYNVGEDEADNSLLITLAGFGKSKVKTFKTTCGQKYKYRIPYSFSGKVSGSLGCGCTVVLHKSATRTIGINGATKKVTDVAPSCGTFTIKYKKSYGRPYIQ